MSVPSSSIQHLPVELVSKCFSRLDVQDLARLALVCRQWSLLAFDHPTYWGTVSVLSADHRHLCLAEHKINIAGDRAYLFEINYTEAHLENDPVRARIIPLLHAAVPQAHTVSIRIESMYRFHVEQELCQEAKNLRYLHICYVSYPLPELYRDLPLGKGKQLLSGSCASLRSVRLKNVILPKIVITAFEHAHEVFFDHDITTYQEEFPCYLFDFFPNVRRLRLTGGECWFRNAPLPAAVLNIVQNLEWLDLEFQHSSMPGFFSHLPIRMIPVMIICSPDEDSIYTALEPLRSYFHLSLFHTFPEEFYITVGCGHSRLVRHFAEPLKYYYPGSSDTNELLENDLFIGQLATLRVQTTIWPRIHWWLPQFHSVPGLIVEINQHSVSTVTLPVECISCPDITTLVLQTSTKYDFVYVTAENVVEFADRLTTRRISLELRRVLVDGPAEELFSRFESVCSYASRIE